MSCWWTRTAKVFNVALCRPCVPAELLTCACVCPAAHCAVPQELLLHWVLAVDLYAAAAAPELQILRTLVDAVENQDTLVKQRCWAAMQPAMGRESS